MKNSSFIKNGLLTLTLIFSFFNLFAQEGYFEQGYGDGDSLLECGHGIYLEDNFNAAVVGYTERSLGGNKDFTLLVHDSLGEQLFVQHYGGEQDEIAYGIIKTTSSSYLLIGYTESFGAGGKDIYIVNVDTLGNIIWTKTIGTTYNEIGRAVVETPLGYMITGYKEYSSVSVDFLLVHIDFSGNLIWQQTYGGTGVQKAYDIKCRNGNYVIAGTDYEVSKPISSGLIVEVDIAGTTIGYYPIIHTESIEIEAIDFDRNNGFLLAGNITFSINNNQNGLFLKIDSIGAIESVKDYGTDSVEKFHDIKRLGGMVVFVGETRGWWSEGKSDMLVVYTDSLGDTIKTHTRGGIGEDVGYSVFYQQGKLYTVGYNDSYGILTSGNIYEGRDDLEASVILIYQGEPMPFFMQKPKDCDMKRVLYVTDAFYAGNINDLGRKLCTWCHLSPWNATPSTMDSIEYEDTALYKRGIIGNTIRENELLSFIKKHGIKEIYFYNTDAIFAYYNTNRLNETEQNYNKYTIVNNTGTPWALSTVDYMKHRLNKFIIRAIKEGGLEKVGFAVGIFDSLNKRLQLFDNLIEYNNFVKNEAYNYKNAGKISALVLEHEYWHWGHEDTDTTIFQAFNNHKDYLVKLLNYKVDNENTQIVNDYIGYLTDNNNRDSIPGPDENHLPIDCSDTLALTRATELENLTDSRGRNTKIDRFFNIYYLSICKDTSIERGSTGARFQRDTWAYRTAVFGKRTGAETQIFPVFGIGSDNIKEIGGFEAGVEDIAFWLATRDSNSTGEIRKMKSIENIFMDDYPLNKYFSHCHNGSNKVFNGFVYFTYQQMQKLSKYNIIKSHTNNFSNLDSTARIAKVEYPTYISLPCYTLIPVYIPKGKTTSDVKIENEFESINIYPNPASSQISIVNRTKFPIHSYTIFDVTGKLLLKETLAQIVYKEQTSIGLSSFDVGVYLIKLSMKDGSQYTYKLIIQ